MSSSSRLYTYFSRFLLLFSFFFSSTLLYFYSYFPLQFRSVLPHGARSAEYTYKWILFILFCCCFDVYVCTFYFFLSFLTHEGNSQAHMYAFLVCITLLHKRTRAKNFPFFIRILLICCRGREREKFSQFECCKIHRCVVQVPYVRTF